MIIDANAHPTADGKWFTTHLNASVANLLNQMDSAGVEKAILVPFEGIISNDFILGVAEENPDRFIPGVSINPGRFANPEEAFKEYKQLFNKCNAKVLKLHNRLHKYELLDERVLAILQANEELSKPLTVFICGLLVSKETPLNLAPPFIFQKIVTLFPKTKFVIMHSGMAWALQVFEAVRDCSNVWLDTSFIQSKFKGSSLWTDLKFLCTNFDQRMIFGSDFPEIGLQQAIDDFNLLTEDISQEKRKNILSENIRKLLVA